MDPLPLRAKQPVLTREELAEAAEVSYGQIRHWERVGLIEGDSAEPPIPAAVPGTKVRVFPVEQRDRAVAIAQLRRAGVSLQAIRAILDFCRAEAPEPVMIEAEGRTALVLVPSSLRGCYAVRPCPLAAGKGGEAQSH